MSTLDELRAKAFPARSIFIKDIREEDLILRFTDAKAALAECEREKQWQPIETAAPDQVGLFWLDWAPGCGGNYGMAQSNHIHYGKRGGWSSLFRATHWMPLPEPPAALTEANEGKQ